MPHSFITLMAERGVPRQVVQAMVSHKSPAMTRYYTHVSNRAAREAVEPLHRQKETSAFVGNLLGDPRVSVPQFLVIELKAWAVSSAG